MTVASVLATTLAARAADNGARSVVTKLDNGLVLVVVPADTAPGVVAWQLWMDVGSGDEVQPGRTGFAHFFEHLMFHGSEAIPADRRASELLRLGVEENAWTWLDDTVYHAVLPASSLPRYAEIEADRFTSLNLTPEGVRREAGAVYGEFRKSQADPDAVLSEKMAAEAFRVHPYGHDTIGLQADIEAMPDAHEDALAFYGTYYRPENATLIVAGDVEPDEVGSLVQRTLGQWEPGTAARPEVPVEPEQQQTRRVTVDWPTPTAPRLAMMWKIPASHPDVATAAALELLGQLLTSPTGRLKERLIREEGLAYTVHGGRDATRDPGVFRIQVALRDAEQLERVERIVREEVAAVAEGVDEAVLKRVRAHVLARRQLASDDPVALANLYGEARLPGLGPDPEVTLRAYLDTIAATKPSDVSEAARTWLVDSGLTVGTLQ